MRQPVKCLNCGLKWLRVTTFGSQLEMIDDLQYNCPKCGSNYCELLPEKETIATITKPQKRPDLVFPPEFYEKPGSEVKDEARH